MRRKSTMILTFMVAGLIACMIFSNSAFAKKPVKIGVVLPLSGGFEIYGNLGVRGAKMAVEEINKAGGVLDGRMLELVIEDNKTDPKTAVEKSKKLNSSGMGDIYPSCISSSSLSLSLKIFRNNIHPSCRIRSSSLPVPVS